MTTTTLTWDGHGLQQLEEWQRRIEPAVRHGLEDIGQEAESTLRALQPEHWTGNYDDGIGHEVNTSLLEVKVGSKAKHAHLVEKGRRPGRMPPVRLIAKLWGVTHREAYPIARSIGKEGTQGSHAVELTAKAMRPDVDRFGLEILKQIHQ